jgi:exopolyphosphatase / guanosine-5'-triphosphate,3'-diphosphate pyrophosphatase
LIKNGDLRGFEPLETDVIALSARYHRRAEPSKDHEGFGELSGELRRTVRVLGAILRLTESLDRSRHSVIRGLRVNTRADTIAVELEARGDAELELWAANRQLDPLARALDRPLRLQTRAVDDAEAPEPEAPSRRGLATASPKRGRAARPLH